VAKGIAGQIGAVADQADDRQRPGLAGTEAESECGFDAAVGVDVPVGVTREAAKDPL